MQMGWILLETRNTKCLSLELDTAITRLTLKVIELEERIIVRGDRRSLIM
jgi:hypothetical protein